MPSPPRPPSTIPPSHTYTGISLWDVAAFVVVMAMVFYFAYMARVFVQRVDDRTLEVSDYSVIVKGLPPASDGKAVSGLSRGCRRDWTARQWVACVCMREHACFFLRSERVGRRFRGADISDKVAPEPFCAQSPVFAAPAAAVPH